MKPRIIFLSILMFLTLALGIISTYAWVISNKNVDSIGFQVSSEKSSSLKTLSVYALKYDGVDGASYTEITDGTTVSMSEYDTIFTDRNVHSPLVLRIIFSVPSVLINDHSEILLKFPATGSYMNGTKVINNLSNVVSISAGCGISSNKVKDTYGTTVDDNNKVTLFDGILEGLENSTITGKYVTTSKASEIDLILPYSEFSIYVPENNQEERVNVVINIKIEYDADLINAYLDSYLPNKDASSTFIADIGKIILEWVVL